MKQKTAIRQLIEKLAILEDDDSLSTDYKAAILVAIQRARAFEPVNEQQIKDAYSEGIEGESYDSTEYFNVTFKKP